MGFSKIGSIIRTILVKAPSLEALVALRFRAPDVPFDHQEARGGGT